MANCCFFSMFSVFGSLLKYGSFFTGASSDFDGATKIAKMMVTRFGMSDKVSLIIFMTCLHFINDWFYDLL